MARISSSIVFAFLICTCCNEKAELPQGEPCLPGTSEIYLLLAIPPLFGNCQYLDIGCNEEKIDEFVINNIHYPQQALTEKIEGNVVVEGVIEKHGCFNIEIIIESLGYGCDEEAIRLINLMPQWQPGRTGGKNDNPERLRTSLTIKFRLK